MRRTNHGHDVMAAHAQHDRPSGSGCVVGVCNESAWQAGATLTDGTTTASLCRWQLAVTGDHPRDMTTMSHAAWRRPLFPALRTSPVSAALHDVTEISFYIVNFSNKIPTSGRMIWAIQAGSIRDILSVYFVLCCWIGSLKFIFIFMQHARFNHCTISRHDHGIHVQHNKIANNIWTHPVLLLCYQRVNCTVQLQHRPSTRWTRKQVPLPSHFTTRARCRSLYTPLIQRILSSEALTVNEQCSSTIT